LTTVGDSVDGLDNLTAWFERLDERPAIQRALEEPEPHPVFFDKGEVAAAQTANAARFSPRQPDSKQQAR